MNKFRSFAVAVVLAATGCTSSGDVSSAPPEATLLIPSNYQLVYANTLAAMRQCYNPGAALFPSPGSVTLDAQLYSELGYGEIIHGLGGLLPGMLSVTRIERNGSGAKVTIKTANQVTAAAAGTRQWIAYWAKGGKQCQTLAYQTPPAL